jgi:hypothetical protein
MEHALEFWNMSHHRLAYQLLHKSMHSRHDHPDISYTPPIGVGFPINGSVHQGPGPSMPEQVANPRDFCTLGRKNKSLRWPTWGDEIGWYLSGGSTPLLVSNGS